MGLKKVLGIALTTVGVAGTIAGTVLLPVGCLKEYKVEMTAGDGKSKMISYMGVGSSNYGNIKYEMTGPLATDEAQKNLDEVNEEAKQAGKELRKNTKYSDFVKDAKDTLDKWDQIKASIPADVEGFGSIDDLKGYLESIVSANSTMISGAVLLPVFAVIMIIGIVLVVLGKNKKAKSAE